MRLNRKGEFMVNVYDDNGDVNIRGIYGNTLEKVS